MLFFSCDLAGDDVGQAGSVNLRGYSYDDVFSEVATFLLSTALINFVATLLTFLGHPVAILVYTTIELLMLCTRLHC